MERSKITRETCTKHLLDFQLKLANKTILDTLSDDRWFFNITITYEQYLYFKKYSIDLIQKLFKCNKSKAKKTFDWFYKGYGVRIKNGSNPSNMNCKNINCKFPKCICSIK